MIKTTKNYMHLLTRFFRNMNSDTEVGALFSTKRYEIIRWSENTVNNKISYLTVFCSANLSIKNTNNCKTNELLKNRTKSIKRSYMYSTMLTRLV